MNSNNNNKQQKQQNNNSKSCEKDLFRDMNDFHMDIKDEFTDPLENMKGFDNLEQRMLNNFKNAFNGYDMTYYLKKNNTQEIIMKNKNQKKIK